MSQETEAMDMQMSMALHCRFSVCIQKTGRVSHIKDGGSARTSILSYMIPPPAGSNKPSADRVWKMGQIYH